MGWVSQSTYVPTVWGNGGKPGPQPPSPIRRAPAPVVEEDTDDKE